MSKKADEDMNWKGRREINKKGQITIFIIIALALILGIIGFFIIKGLIVPEGISPEIAPVFDYYTECISNEASTAASYAGTQGGYVYVPEYILGSDYAPFSSQLNMLGVPVPYWYYVSGNGMIKEQMPSKSDMERDIERYINENLNENCRLDEFYAKGLSISVGEPETRVTIEDEKIIVEVKADIRAAKENSTARKTSYRTEVGSKLGKFYKIARSIYEEQRKNAFLENYSIDVLRLYAPVDGVELGCSGKIWKTREVVNELKSGLEANINAIKIKGNYYRLAEEENKYFVKDIGTNIDESVNLIYSQRWPTRIEIAGEGVGQELMIAEPVGTQSGMGMMGFCYSPYHFVYDVSFPVLIQVYDSKEVFQFPVVVIIDNNVPREAVFSEIPVEAETPDLCQYRTQEVEIRTYDVNLNPVEAEISIKCFNQKCKLGETKNGVFEGYAPACGNAYIIAEAEGYTEKKQIISTNEERFAELILDKEYEVNVELIVGGRPLEGNAIVSFTSESITRSIALPSTEKIKLSEGFYDVNVYVYGNTSIVIPASTKRQCQQVTRTGIAGIFGMTEEKCFDINLPETKIDSALIGGGKSEIYILPSDLEKGNITLRASSMPMPKTLDDLAANFVNFEDMEVYLEL